MSRFGHCPTCHSRLSCRADACPACGEREFIRLVKRRVADTPCYDCNYVYSGRPGEPGCGRCHGHGFVVVYMAKRVDQRTGKAGIELRYEAAPDTWQSEQLS